MHTLYTDGGSRGNPGDSAIGFFIFDEQMKLVDFGGKYLGIVTNNNAEYKALIEGLKLAIKNKIKKLKCVLDSELVVKQINGLYKISSPEIKIDASKVMDLRKEFDEISFNHVLRSENKFADKLVNIILDTKQKNA